METNKQDEFIIDEQAIRNANILDPDIYYQDTFYPDRRNESEPYDNPKFPPLEKVLKEYSKKGERLMKQKAVVQKLMDERNKKY